MANASRNNTANFAPALRILWVLCLVGCNAPATPGLVYTLNTPLEIITASPQGKAILVRDIPEVLYSQHYQTSGTLSLAQIANTSGTIIPPAQLAKVQADFAALAAPQPSGVPTAAYMPPAALYPTSYTCNDGNTPVQNTVCENQQLASLDVQMAASYQQHLGTADVFTRDQLLATQRAWLLSLPTQCGITASPTALSCLTTAYQAQIAALSAWPTPTAADGAQRAAMTTYVHYKLLNTTQPTLCSAIGSNAAAALSADGAIDPTRLAGAQEIAGSHGPASGTTPQGGTITVDLYQANLYGGYQTRARAVSLSGTPSPLLGPSAVGAYVQTLPNGGGRYVSTASQTGDYGDIDVFAFQGQLLALLTDTIGYNSPAPPGEAAVAAIFTIAQGQAQPACLYETYLMPAPLSMGIFGTQPSLTPFLALVDTIQGTPADALAASDRQDSAYFAAATRWTMLNMPQVTLAQAQSGNWTGWLRSRHDQVLDALYTWSQKSPQNQAAFTQLFTLLQPAAKDLEGIYLQQQGMTQAGADQATALAMMELLYQSSINFAPGLGAGPADPSHYKSYQPRYPILASPQS